MATLRSSVCRLLAALACVAVAVGAEAEPVVVGIANFGPHPALDQAIAGFKQELHKQGFVEGRDVRYVAADANFTPSLIPQVLGQIEAQRPAVILTVTTPVSQGAITGIANKSVPLVFLLISDPVSAGLVPDWQHGSARFVGSASAMDYDAVLGFAKRMFPGARKFGVLYAPGEANDVVAVKAIETAAKKADLALQAVSVDSTIDVPQRSQLLSGVDFVYAIGSNLVQSAMPAVASVTDRYKIPILSAETEMIRKGVVTVSYAASYPLQGGHAGRLAADILRGKKPSELSPIKPGQADYVPLISRRKLKQLGKELPVDLVGCNCFVD